MYLTLSVTLQPIDHKNIRRRVYDALNVLMAMNIISKEKKEIKWIGLPTNSIQECQHIEVRALARGGTIITSASAWLIETADSRIVRGGGGGGERKH